MGLGLKWNKATLCVLVFACTHVESGSLSLLPRPGILKAFARLFFPPSGAKAVMYSSKPARAAEHQHMHPLFAHFFYVLLRLHDTVWKAWDLSLLMQAAWQAAPGLSLPVPFCSANFWIRLSMPMFSTFCLNSSWTCRRAQKNGPLQGIRR